jgi:hypothetical protein
MIREMTVLFFISLGWCQAETKGPRPLVTAVAETFIDNVATTDSSYFVNHEEICEQLVEILGTLTKQDKAHRIININNADRFDSSSVAEISSLRTPLVECAIKKLTFYIFISILIAFLVAILFLTVSQILFLKRKRSDECERFIVNAE